METLENKIQVVIKEFDNSCYKNRLIIKFKKTVTMEFHTKLKPPNISFNFNGALITPSASSKFLGIYLDSHLPQRGWLMFIMLVSFLQSLIVSFCGSRLKTFSAFLSYKKNNKTYLQYPL
nr:unnamed protein product [Callosobruchus analis]